MDKTPENRLEDFPGGDLVETGLADLSRGVLTEKALLVLIAGPRLRHLGFDIQEPEPSVRIYEHQLYALIEKREPDYAHREYNALIARLVSFANAYEQVVVQSQNT